MALPRRGVEHRCKRPIEHSFKSGDMGQSRKDRQWPRPSATRHVWVLQQGPQVPPVQGMVLDWKRHGYHWWALVLTVTQAEGAGPVTVTEWLPLGRLVPVRSDPNDGRARRL